MSEFGLGVKDAAATQPEISVYDVQDVLYMGQIPESDAMLASVRSAVAGMHFETPDDRRLAEEVSSRDHWRLDLQGYSHHSLTTAAESIDDVPPQILATLGSKSALEAEDARGRAFALSFLKNRSNQLLRLHESIRDAERLEELWDNSRHALRPESLSARYEGHYRPNKQTPLPRRDHGVPNTNRLASRLAAEAKSQREEGTLYRTGYSRNPEVVRHRREGFLARTAKKLGKVLLSTTF